MRDVRKIRSVEDRVTVGLETRVPSRLMIKKRVMSLARKIKPTGAIAKLEPSLHVYGFNLGSDVRKLDIRLMADLKCVGLPETLRRYGTSIAEMEPEFVTVMCNTGSSSMRALRETLPRTDVMGVTLLSSTKEGEVLRTNRLGMDTMVVRYAEQAVAAGVKNLVCAPKYIWRLRREFGTKILINAVGMRPSWAQVGNEDQESVMTPREAILAGADRVIIERPVVEADDPYDATMRVIEEVDNALYELIGLL